MTYQVKIGNNFYMYKTYRANGKVKCEYVGKVEPEAAGQMTQKPETIELKQQLKGKNVKNVSFDGKAISLNFDEKSLKNNIVVKEHLGRVGAWAKGANEIYYDNDIKDFKEQKSVSVHETVEKYVSEKYGLSESDAHDIAEDVEERFAKTIGIDWAEYTKRVLFVHKKEEGYAY